MTAPIRPWVALTSSALTLMAFAIAGAATPAPAFAGAPLAPTTAEQLRAAMRRHAAPLPGDPAAAARWAALAPTEAASSPRRPVGADKAGVDIHLGALTTASPDQSRGDCTPAVLASGATNGQLADGDCRWGQLTGLPDVSLVDVYRLQADGRQRVRLTASAPGFDALVTLRAESRYAEIVSASATGAGADAAIDVVLPAGTYFVLVTNATDSGGPVPSGAYRLDAVLGAEDEPTGCTPQPLPAGGVPGGDLGASGCLGYDYFPHRWWTGSTAVYQATLAEPGTLNLDVSATGHTAPRMVVLTRTGLTVIDTTLGDPNPVGATHLSVALPLGTFLVVVYAEDAGQVGAFGLTASVTSSAAACRPIDAALNMDIAATLDNGCRLAHLNNGGYFNNPMDLYALTVPQDGEVTFSLKSRTADVDFLMFVDNELHDRMINGPIGDGYQTTLPPGQYHISVWSTTGALGDYTLRFNYVPTGVPCQLAPLTLGATTGGDIAATDCTFADFLPDLAIPHNADIYVLDVPARGEVVLKMTSTALDPYLALFGGPLVETGYYDYFLAANDDIVFLTDTNAEIKATLWPGRYLLVALDTPLNALPGAGAYELVTKFTPQAAPAPCAATALGPNAQLAAALSGDECRSFDRNPRHFSTSLEDRYVMDVPSYGVLTIKMTAPTFSPRIQLGVGPFVDPIGADADPDRRGHDALLEFVAAPGQYWLDAEEAGGIRDVTGAYALETTFVPRPTCTSITDVTPLPYDHTGAIAADDCMLGDAPLAAQITNPVDLYRVTVSEVGTLNVDLESTAIDPALYVIDARWSILEASTDIDETDTNSRIRLGPIAPGTYYLAAISTDSAGRGDYRLRVSFEPAPLVIPTPGAPVPTATTPAVEPTPSPRPTATTGGRVFLPMTLR
ncbi:MAG: pre-peptidase C-terminal domain-containing protein [Ardenticatenales bacterium]